MFTAPKYIKTELKAIDHRLICVWNPRRKRWQVRLWGVAHPIAWDLKNFDLWLSKSSLCHTACERDGDYRDTGYRKLDRRVISTILQSRWNEQNPDEFAGQVDEHNTNMFLKAELETEDITKDCGKRLYHYLQRPTVYLGGK